jgi:hypothetical protein
MGGRHFIVLYILLKNGYRITLFTLINFRVNGFTFINTAYINNISIFLNLKPKPLIQSIIPKGFNRQLGKAITYILTLHLSINGQRQKDIPFIILDLGNYNIILGLKWMSYFNI